MVVNYPLRRRIVSAMMVVGNLGLVSDGYSLCEHPVPSYLHGKSRDRLAKELLELELTLLAVQSPKKSIRSADSPDQPIHEDQLLVLFGPD